VVSQIDNLDIHINVKLPMEGLSDGGGKTQVNLNALIKDGGALVYLGTDFKPSVEIPLWKPGTKIPLISPFFKIRLLKLSLDENRQVDARVCYLFIPFNYNVHDKLIDKIKKGDIPDELLKSNGVNWNNNVPLYSWQILDTLFEIQKHPPNKTDKSTDESFNNVKPVWDEGGIDIKGNFSNQKIELEGLTLDFAELPKGHKSRFTVRGPITSPILKVNGLSGISLGSEKGFVHFGNENPNEFPWVIQAVWDPTNKKKPVFNIPQFKSNKIFIETIFKNGKERSVRLDMDEGIELSGVSVDLNHPSPLVTIKKITAKQLSFEGFGTTLQTEPGNIAIMENMSLVLDSKKPVFNADLRSKAKGSVSYFMNNEELGHINYDFINEAKGHVHIGHDENDKTKVSISGQIETKMPDLRLFVRSEKIHGFVKVEIADAFVGGSGTLNIWPYSSEIEVKGDSNHSTVHIEGKKGQVRFGQNAFEIPEWAEELKKLVPPELMSQAKTDVAVDIKHISFDFSKLKLISAIANSDGKPAFQIDDTLMGPIKVSGTLKKGLFFLRIPTGLFMPWDLTKDWNQNADGKRKKGEEAPLTDNPNIDMTIDLLSDKTDENDTQETERKIKIENIFLKIEETKDTFSPRDQKRCGAKRQHIHVNLRDFLFSPAAREFELNGLTHTHVVLKSPFGKGPRGSSGCFVLE